MTSVTSTEIYIGLMSGTSLDGVDVAITDFGVFPPRLLHASTTPYRAELQDRLLQLCHSQNTSLDGLYSLHAELGEVYAAVVNAALEQAGIGSEQVIAIGCHGQTIRHSPNSDMPYTAQIGDPNRIAVRTGITTVADFRGKDIALGGQAAPLAPAFHRFLFRSSTQDRALINIGGIANVTYLPADDQLPILGFDTGPGNTLLDYWTRRHLDKAYDDAGNWARAGRLDNELLQRMIDSETYFSQPPPKSTGTEYFNPDWLAPHIDSDMDAGRVQASLVELTVSTIAMALKALPQQARACYVCGGGARNQFLLERLSLALPECDIATTAELGLEADFVEACAFAWLARERINLREANAPEVTQARRATVLGAVYAAS